MRARFEEPRLIPAPKRMRRLDGACERPARWADDWPANADPAAPDAAFPSGGMPRVRVTARPGSAESYALRIEPGRITIEGHGGPGLFYGLQTLKQLVRQYGRVLPALDIEDEPFYAHRGFYLDISRGRVPRVAWLKRLIDRLAALKYNQLQLYFEHPFHFAFDPDIAAGCDRFEPDELLELDAYASERFIRFVPSLTCFGHMGHILSLPRYRELAACPWPARDWAHADWLTRLRGATLNPLRAGSRRLIRNMLDDFLPLFRDASFNMCGDETYDLGKGRSAREAARRGVGALYLDHVRFVRDVAARHGKRLQLWGDVPLRYPEALAGLPDDCTALDWGYFRGTPYDKVARFVERGLAAYVCPSTHGFKSVFNEVEEARDNIVSYARAGVRHGASGLLLTEWGDRGHFNMPACSSHGLALGAAMAWNPASDAGRAFDRAFGLHVCGDASGAVAKAILQAGSSGLAHWPFHLTHRHPNADPALLRNIAREKVEAVRSAAHALERAPREGGLWAESERAETALGAQAVLLNIDTLLEGVERGAATSRAPSNRLREAFERFFEAYGRAWLSGHRPRGLTDIRRRVFGPARRRLHGP